MKSIIFPQGSKQGQFTVTDLEHNCVPARLLLWVALSLGEWLLQTISPYHILSASPMLRTHLKKNWTQAWAMELIVREKLEFGSSKQVLTAADRALYILLFKDFVKVFLVPGHLRKNINIGAVFCSHPNRVSVTIQDPRNLSNIWKPFYVIQ